MPEVKPRSPADPGTAGLAPNTTATPTLLGETSSVASWVAAGSTAGTWVDGADARIADTITALTFSGGAFAHDIATQGRNVSLALTADFTVSNPTNPTAGMELTQVFVQGGAGGYRATWGSAFVASPAIRLELGAVTIIEWRYSGAAWDLASPQRRGASRRTVAGATWTLAASDGTVYQTAAASVGTLPALAGVPDDAEYVVAGGNAAGVYGLTPNGAETIWGATGASAFVYYGFAAIILFKASTTAWGIK